MQHKHIFTDIPVVSLGKTGGLTSAMQLIDVTSNEMIYSDHRETASNTGGTVVILPAVPYIAEEEQKPVEASERRASRGLMSEQIAAELRSKKVSAFVPVTAADLIWMDAEPSEDDLDD